MPTLGLPVAILTLSGVGPRPATPADIEETPFTDAPRVESPVVAASSDAGPGARVEESLDHSGEVTHRNVRHRTEPVGNGLERAMRMTGRGVRKAIEKTGEGLRRAGEALSGEPV